MNNNCEVMICDENGQIKIRSLGRGIKIEQEKARPFIDALDAATTPSWWDFLPWIGQAKKLKAIRAATKVGVPVWKGSGPTAGVLGINALSKSNKAIKNFNPKNGVEFIFDPKTNTFLVGRPQRGFTGSPHEQLARTIGADEATVLGGSFTRVNGKIVTNENSGHYGDRWTDATRKDFTNAMSSYGLDVTHLDDF